MIHKEMIGQIVWFKLYHGDIQWGYVYSVYNRFQLYVQSFIREDQRFMFYIDERGDRWDYARG